MKSSDSSTPSLGQVGYEAYGNPPGPAGKWATYDGRAMMPNWPELGGGDVGMLTQARWEASAAAIIAEHERRKQESGDSGVNFSSITVSLAGSTGPVSTEALAAAAERVGAGLAATSTLTDEGRIDPFLLGIQEIASATRDLAEAAHCLPFEERSGPIGALVNDVTKALHDRVKTLVAPTPPASA